MDARELGGVLFPTTGIIYGTPAAPYAHYCVCASDNITTLPREDRAWTSISARPSPCWLYTESLCGVDSKLPPVAAPMIVMSVCTGEQTGDP